MSILIHTFSSFCCFLSSPPPTNISGSHSEMRTEKKLTNVYVIGVDLLRQNVDIACGFAVIGVVCVAAKLFRTDEIINFCLQTVDDGGKSVSSFSAKIKFDLIFICFPLFSIIMTIEPLTYTFALHNSLKCMDFFFPFHFLKPYNFFLSSCNSSKSFAWVSFSESSATKIVEPGSTYLTLSLQTLHWSSCHVFVNGQFNFVTFHIYRVMNEKRRRKIYVGFRQIISGEFFFLNGSRVHLHRVIWVYCHTLPNFSRFFPYIFSLHHSFFEFHQRFHLWFCRLPFCLGILNSSHSRNKLTLINKM